MAVTGVVLGYVGLVAVLSFFVVSAVTSTPPDGETVAVATEADKSSEEPADSRETEPQEEDTREADPTPSPTRSVFTQRNYRRLSARGFGKLVKNPDAYAGKRFVLYGEVFQFDSATGSDSFLANTGPARLQPSYGYVSFDQNAAFTGSESRLADVVKDDLFQAYVTVIGSYGYETQIGGNTTVPRFRIDRIKVYGNTK